MDLYLRGAHPIEKVGCTACHQGARARHELRTAAHTASTKEQEKAWGRYSATRAYEPLHHWDLPMLAKGHTESQCVKCHRGVVEVPKAERLNTGACARGALRLLRLPQDQGLGEPRKVGPDLTKIASKTSDEWIYRWIKEPQGLRPTRMPQIWDVRIDETAEQKARNDVEANAVVAYVVEKSARRAIPRRRRATSAGAQIFERWAAWAATGWATTSAGSRASPPPTSAPTARTSTAPGSKVNAGWLYAWVRNPKGVLARDQDAEPAAHGEGGGRRHRLPDEPRRTRPSWPAPAPRSTRRVRDDDRPRSTCEAQFPVKQAEEKLAAMRTTASARSSSARRRSAATAASAATPSRASRRPRPSAWS